MNRLYTLYFACILAVFLPITCMQGPQLPNSEATVKLFDSIDRNSLEDFCDALRKDADVNARSPMGITPLHLAAAKGFYTFVVFLATLYDAQLNTQDNEEKTPLLDAIEGRYIEIVAFLLRHNANPNQPAADGMPPLHKAIILRDKQVASLLLDRNADIHYTFNNMDALSLATSQGSEEIVRLILDHSPTQEVDRTQALALAIMAQNKNLTQLLAFEGMKFLFNDALSCDNTHLCEEISRLDPELSLLNTTESKDDEAHRQKTVCFIQVLLSRHNTCIPQVLVTAARVNDQDVATLLTCQESTPVNTPYQGLTPLAVAALAGHQEIVELLLAHPTIVFNPINERTKKPLIEELQESKEDRTAMIQLIEGAIAQQRSTPRPRTIRSAFSDAFVELRQGVIDIARQFSSAAAAAQSPDQG